MRLHGLWGDSQLVGDFLDGFSYGNLTQNLPLPRREDLWRCLWKRFNPHYLGLSDAFLERLQKIWDLEFIDRSGQEDHQKLLLHRCKHLPGADPNLAGNSEEA